MERKQSRKGGKERQRGENWGFTGEGGGGYKANTRKGRNDKKRMEEKGGRLGGSLFNFCYYKVL